MFVRDGAVVTSASDLKSAVECEWATMRRLDARLGRVEAVPDPVDALNRRAAGLGDEHERRRVEAYRTEFGEHVPGTPGGVATIALEGDRTDAAALSAAQDRTLAAIRDGADVVFQATLFTPPGDAGHGFVGFADFLRRTAEGWSVEDTKLARRAKVTALLQLAAYAGRLRALGVPVAPVAHLLLGDGTDSPHRLADVEPVFDARTRRLHELIDDRLADPEPIAWGAGGVAACGRCAECTAQIEATRDVLLVGRLTVRQRERLRAVGVRTIDEFAASSGPIEGIGSAALQRLRLQARLQLETPPGDVTAEVIDEAGLAALPEPDDGDVFFDFEGDPLWTDDDRTWGLEYLFGSVVLEGGREVFHPFWAHDRAQEKQALTEFLHWIRERRRRHPGMHVYHYADYERSHLQALCARHGVGEAILDELLREHVLVDLYPVVLRTVRISDRSYSLKRLEPLYMGDRLRLSDVTTGAGSVEAWVEHGRLVEQHRDEEAAALLAELADYNRYDCASTLGLRDWLLSLADERGIGRRPALPDEPEADPGAAREEDLLRERLLAGIADVPRADRTAAQTATAMAAAAVEYHRREAKTFWWEHYDREIAAVDDWADQKDVLVVDAGQVLADWGREGRQRVDRRQVRLVGALAPGSGLKRGDAVHVMYDEPVPTACAAVPAGQRGEHEHGEVVAVDPLPDGRTAVVVEEACPGGSNPWSTLPIALTPGKPLPTLGQRRAIREWGEALADDPEREDAVLDLLRRRPPRLAAGGTRSSDVDPDAAAIVRDLLLLERSYLAVQGPPGSGKTHVGAEVVATLVRDHGWRVGVVAQSHAVVENLLDRVVAAGLDADRVRKRVSGAGTVGDWRPVEPDRPVGVTMFVHHRRESGYVLGGTAWTFCNAAQVPRGELDLLVIDEAGQFSLANTIAVGVSARNLLLLGDPQQLPQVSQGLHPEPVDAAALGWLANGRDVLPAAFGVFLPETWRMHPALTRAVSDLSYEGRLGSREPETTARSLAGVLPGVHPLPLHHPGDTVESASEARAVLDLVRSHLGLSWTDPSRNRYEDPLREEDLIVVAPFNAQVALLRQVLDDAGFRGVRVGTVDRFQGQEAVVAIVSLTASSPADVPRGIGFVLNRNRLNVAVSRAQWVCHLVHSPALADHLPHDAQGVADLAGFLRLTAAAAPALLAAV